jgi:hypothetical protein
MIALTKVVCGATGITLILLATTLGGLENFNWASWCITGLGCLFSTASFMVSK